MEGIANVDGLGVQGVVDGHAVVVGCPGCSPTGPRQFRTPCSPTYRPVPTAVAVGWDGEARGVLLVADAVKPTSAEAVRALRELGLTPILLTGDNERDRQGGRRSRSASTQTVVG